MFIFFLFPSNSFQFFTLKGLKKTDIFSYGILLTTNSAKLNSSTTFESYGLGGLTDTGEPSTIFKLSSTDVLSSHFLSSVAQLSAQMKSDITPVPYGAIGTSIDLTSVWFTQDNYYITPSITGSLMKLSIFPAQASSLEQCQTVTLSATDISSVISIIQDAEIKLNSQSLLSCGFLLTTASTSAPSVLSRLPQEDTGEESAAFSVSIGEYWTSLSPSITLDSPAQTFISKQAAFLSSLVMHEARMRTCLPSESLVITVSSINQRLTNIKSQSADSLSELSQICATCSMTEIKPSDEFSDPVLHSKQSPFYETFWMNSMILSSWYTLMEVTAITSGHSFSSASEITSSVEFTELSSSYPTKERDILSIHLQGLKTHFPYFDSDYITMVPSQAISLESSFSTIMFAQEVATELTRKLMAVEQLTAKQILQPLESKLNDPIMEISQLKSQDSLVEVQLNRASQEPLTRYISNSSSEHQTNLQFSLDGNLEIFSTTIQSSVLETYFPSTEVPFRNLTADHPEKYAVLESSADMISYLVLSEKSPPAHNFSKILATENLLSPTDYLVSKTASQEPLIASVEPLRWLLSTHVHDKELFTNLNTFLPKSHSVPPMDSTPGLHHLASGEFSVSIQETFGGEGLF